MGMEMGKGMGKGKVRKGKKGIGRNGEKWGEMGRKGMGKEEKRNVGMGRKGNKGKKETG